MVDPIPAGHRTVTPYLIASDATKLVEFAKAAFGAEETVCMKLPDGTVMHGEFRIGDSMVMFGQAGETWPAMPACLHLYVPNVDELYAQAVAAGGKPLREPVDTFYGDRTGGVEDPVGNAWWIATHVEDVSPEEIERRRAAQK